jgi:hypothetical protein
MNNFAQETLRLDVLFLTQKMQQIPELVQQDRYQEALDQTESVLSKIKSPYWLGKVEDRDAYYRAIEHFETLKKELKENLEEKDK